MSCDAKSLFSLIIPIVLVAACGASVRPFPNRPPMTADPDQRPFAGTPEEYESPFAWDAANQTVFRPIARFFAVDPAGRAVNVNAMDEVPDSSWFVNRDWAAFTPERASLGACEGVEPLDPAGPWTITEAKPDGYNAGFFIEDASGRKFLVKVDGTRERERPTAADVIGSLMYHAAGYHTSCNGIAYVTDDIFRIEEGAEAEDEHGRERPMTREDIETVLSKATRSGDRYRFSYSLFLEGRPLGPFTYSGTRDDDPNDVVPHEDRRDLRGMMVLASWLNHFDSREQNSMSMWIETPDGSGRGYVRHNMIDFGDSFGSLWAWDGISRQLGHAYYLDVPYMAEDFVTLGIRQRPWDRARRNWTGIFGYYDVERFEPESWRSGYPNPAFVRAQEDDAAWMARRIARFRDDHVRAMVARGQFSNPAHGRELARILVGRRDRILYRWLGKLSSLTEPEVQVRENGAELCLLDLGLHADLAAPEGRHYAGRAWWGRGDLDEVAIDRVTIRGDQACVALASHPRASRSTPYYVIIDLTQRGRDRLEDYPARVHLYDLGDSVFRVVGLERPENDDGDL
jgi:hypothetical protein